MSRTKDSPIGVNRTGMGSAPLQGNEMLAGSGEGTPGDAGGVVQLRESYIAAREPIGSMPLPTTPRGILTAAASVLSNRRPNVFLDRLGERLAFERTGVRLYDALISHMEVLQDPKIGPTLEELRTFREQEYQHFQLLLGAIESLGGDPTAQTPAADVAAVCSTGLVQILTDPRSSRSACLQAMLIAELADNDGWQLVVDLAREMGQDAMATDFQRCVLEENVHLERVREWLSEQVRVDLVDGRLGVDS